MNCYFFSILCLIILINLVIIGCNGDLLKVGCFAKKDNDGLQNIDDEPFESEKSASACVSTCRNNMKRFAGIYSGRTCLCGEYYSGLETEDCKIKCEANPEEICGGSLSISIYETAGGALGAPQDLKIIESSENYIHVTWKPPLYDLININEYFVKAFPLFYFNEQEHPQEKLFKFSSLTQTAILGGLLAGTKYNISIAAVSTKGEGYRSYIESWTKVGTPDKPREPRLLSKTSTTMMVELEPVVPSGGPISFYHIVVVDETLPVVIDFSVLSDYKKATANGLPYYVAAELNPEEFDTIFNVGDNKYYGQYFNAELQNNKDYHILLGVLSTINETKYAYSDSNHMQHESYHSHRAVHHSIKKTTRKEVDSIASVSALDYKTILGLSIAVGIFAFLLVSSIIIYILLRVYYKKNTRRNTDHQELAVHAQIPNQDYENGYAVGAHYLDDEDALPNHYRQLREKVKIYPHQSINIVADIGVGKFGSIKKGIFLNQESERINALIHRVEDDSLKPAHKSEMLKDFDVHIKLGNHPSVVSLLGLLEELHIVSFVFEYETLSLKSYLLESRAVQHYPVYAEKNRRFSTLQEQQVLNILVGIARGMAYMYSLNISHGQLCARNVVLRDGIIPKISGFGLIHHHNDVYIPDYRRWLSHERLRSNIITPVGDVWSFGCLMWEVVTLGGTPYADVQTEELSSRIVRGLRLAQPQYLSDELYQSMLLCWQNDSDERPSFVDLEELLQNVSSDEITPHLLFSLYQSFKYEPYSSPLEFLD